MSIFKKKRKIIVDIETHNVIFGSYCPKCKENGGLFHYDNVYICENCMSRFSDEEYNRLLLIEKRKQKLDLINEKNNIF